MIKQLMFRATAFACSIIITFAWTSRVMAEEPSYYEDVIEPILRQNCLACHHAKKSEGGLNLESLEGLLRGGDSGAVVVPREAKASLITHRVSSQTDSIMPPMDNKVGAQPLTADQRLQLSRWIDGGSQTRGTRVSIDTAVQVLPAHLKTIYSLAISADGDFLAYGRGNELIFESMHGRWGKSSTVAAANTAQVIGTPHRDFIYSMAFSPDGLRLATGSSHEVKLWRRVDILPDQSIPSLTAQIPRESQLITPCSDASKWAYVTDERRLHIVEPVPRTAASESEAVSVRIRRLGAHPERIVAMAWSPAGDRLWSVDTSGWLVAWHIGSTPGSNSKEENVPATAMQLPQPVTSLQTLNASTVVGLQNDEHVIAWELKLPETLVANDPPRSSSWQWSEMTHGPLLEALNSKAPIQSLAISKDGALVAFRRALQPIELWNTQEIKQIGEFRNNRRRQLTITRAEQNVRRQASSIERLTASLGDLQKLVENENKSAETAKIAQASATTELLQQNTVVQQAAVAVSEQEQAMAQAQSALDAAKERLSQVVQALEAKKKLMVDSEQKAAVAKKNLDSFNQALAAVQESQRTASDAVTAKKQRIEQEQQYLAALHTQVENVKSPMPSPTTATKSICFDHDQSHLLSLNDSQTIEVFSVQSLEGLSQPIAIEADPASIFSLPDNRFVSANAHAQIQSWSLRPTWELDRIISNEGRSIIEERVTALAFSPDGAELAIGSGLASRTGSVVICDTQDGRVTRRLSDLHTDVVLGLAYSPDGRILASCSADRMTKLSNARTGSITRILEGHTHHVLGIAWQDDGAKLASASADGTIKIWDVETGETRRTIGIGRELSALAFVGGSTQLLSAASDRLIRMHDIDSGNSLRQFGPSSDAIYALAISPDQHFLIAAGQDGTVRGWQIADAKLILELKP